MRRSPGRTRILLSALVLVALLVVVFVVAHQASAPADDSSSQPTGQFMTMDPLIIANLTQLPHATPLAGQDANDIAGLRALVVACAAYDAGRLKQMNEQMDFILEGARKTQEYETKRPKRQPVTDAEIERMVNKLWLDWCEAKAKGLAGKTTLGPGGFFQRESAGVKNWSGVKA